MWDDVTWLDTDVPRSSPLLDEDHQPGPCFITRGELLSGTRLVSPAIIVPLVGVSGMWVGNVLETFDIVS